MNDRTGVGLLLSEWMSRYDVIAATDVTRETWCHADAGE